MVYHTLCLDVERRRFAFSSAEILRGAPLFLSCLPLDEKSVVIVAGSVY